MRIDHVYCRTVQLFDEAAADNHFSERPFDVDSDGNPQELDQPDPEQFHDIAPFHPIITPALCLFLRRKTVLWLRKLSEVLPVFLTHQSQLRASTDLHSFFSTVPLSSPRFHA
jgi:hypothetical protein